MKLNKSFLRETWHICFKVKKKGHGIISGMSILTIGSGTEKREKNLMTIPSQTTLSEMFTTEVFVRI